VSEILLPFFSTLIVVAIAIEVVKATNPLSKESMPQVRLRKMINIEIIDKINTI
jgi:hypothetical protein